MNALLGHPAEVGSTVLPGLMPPAMRRVQRVHFVGIGGIGMSGIAEVLLNLGYRVSGSDLKASAATEHLAALGARIAVGHDAAHVLDADVVVVSSAVSVDNPEVRAALQQRVPVVPRAEMLAELMRFRVGVAVAGSHGKTTTTSLIAHLLAEGGQDPTYVIGGRLNQAGHNARLGSGQVLVAEADESDGSFLRLSPLLAVVTNIDADHLPTYEGDFQRLQEAFVEFLHRLPFYGLAVLCADDPVLNALQPRIGRPVLRYGMAEDADVRATEVVVEGFRSRLTVHHRDWAEPVPMTVALPGLHSVQNALAAIAVAVECDVSPEAIARGLQSFAGIGRRMQDFGERQLPGGGRVRVIDDYGHHPRELAATRSALRAALPGRRQWLVFQPHRFSRTRDLFEDFAAELAAGDVAAGDGLVLCEVYAAGEAPIAGADARALARAIRSRGGVQPMFAEQVQAVPDLLERVLASGDVVVTMGAGDIGGLAPALARRWPEAGAGMEGAA